MEFKMIKYLFIFCTSLGLINIIPLQGACQTNSNTGFYVGISGGANFLDIDSFNGWQTDMKNGYYLSGAVGYKFCTDKWLITRLESEVSYRRNSFAKVQYLETKQDISGYASTTRYMVNTYFDFNPPFSIKPYWGYGMGYVTVNGKDNDITYKSKSGGLATQWIAGLTYPICEKLDIGLEYRYLGCRQNCRDHTMNVTLKKFF
jgi:opacity protein-like surface antigen